MAVYGDCRIVVRSIDLAWYGFISMHVCICREQILRSYFIAVYGDRNVVV